MATRTTKTDDTATAAPAPVDETTAALAGLGEPGPEDSATEVPIEDTEAPRLYPVDENGAPLPGVPFLPGDDIQFALGLLEHLVPEQFDRLRQQFMQAANEERAA